MTSKTALITGAAQRIGAHLAEYLHAKGMNVIVHYHRSKTAADALIERLNAHRPNSALAVSGDLRAPDNQNDQNDQGDRGDQDVYAHLIEQSLLLNGRLDILINNASLFYPTPIGAISVANWDDLIGTNLKAPLFLSQHAAAALRKQRGCIINLTDIHGAKPLSGHALYSVAKAGLMMLTQALAKELAPAVRVNAIAPGAILWPAETSADEQAKILDQIPMQRQGSADDIAKTAYFLATAADYISGVIINVDGGRALQ